MNRKFSKLDIYLHINYNFFPFHLFKPYTYTGTHYQVFWSNKHLINAK